MNLAGQISKGLKTLLVKMLAVDPLKRVPLESLLSQDEWVSSGPNSSMMNLDEYISSMHEIYSELNSPQDSNNQSSCTH